MTTSSGRFVGIDVAKDKLDIAVLGEKKASQVGNDESGITKLIKKMKDLKPDLIVVEATGGYQRAVVLGLHTLRPGRAGSLLSGVEGYCAGIRKKGAGNAPGRWSAEKQRDTD